MTTAIAVTREQVKSLAPRAIEPYLASFDQASAVLGVRLINAAPLRVAHFMAQLLHETGGLTILAENMSYRAERIVAVWPERFPTVDAAKPYERNPEALANKVYGGRMGNRLPGDGYRFRGRGMLQITGRESYTRFGMRLALPLADNPDLAIDPRWSLAIAAEEWVMARCNTFADADDIVRVTRAINGGTVGLDSRREWLQKTKAVWR